MPKKVSVKHILELRANGISQRNIELITRISRHTISNVFKTADIKSITWKDIKDLDENQAYEMLFPQKESASIFEEVDYSYVHSELKKVGVTLKLLWN